MIIRIAIGITFNRRATHRGNSGKAVTNAPTMTRKMVPGVTTEDTNRYV